MVTEAGKIVHKIAKKFSCIKYQKFVKDSIVYSETDYPKKSSIDEFYFSLNLTLSFGKRLIVLSGRNTLSTLRDFITPKSSLGLSDAL